MLSPLIRWPNSLCHYKLREGDTITISRPRNNFVLYENASKFILISGGIGITPLLAMSKRLSSLHKPFELHICARNKSLLPYPRELTSLPFADNITTHLDDTEGRTSLDADTVFGKPDDNTLLYLCGPQGFMDYLRDQAIAQGWKEANIQTESFSATISKEVENHAFTAKLAKSQRSISVEPEQTLIDALHHASIEAPYACMQGTCGTCLTGVIDGEADHRDAYLSETERKANDKLCLCVSRAKGNEITLDL